MKLCFDQNDIIVNWVWQRIPEIGEMGFGPSTALGVVSESGIPLAGAVFHDYRPDFKSVMISFAADSPRWASRNIVSLILGYPFCQLGVHKLRAAVPHTNEKSLRLTKGIGFCTEGTLRDEFGPGKHAVMWRMFAKDYARLYNGEKGRRLAA